MKKANKTIDDKAFQDLCYKHVLWLKSTYTAGDRLILINYDLSKINFDYMVLHLADLSYCDFSKNILINTEFCGANLRGSNFDFTYCHKVDFRGANLKDASFEGYERTNSCYYSPCRNDWYNRYCEIKNSLKESF